MAEAPARRKTGPGTRRSRERLEVVCWCGKRTYLVPAADVRAGRTQSCGRGCSSLAASR